MPKMIQSGTDSFEVRRDLYRGKLVFWLFIASLGMFFAAMILVYVLLMSGMRSEANTTSFSELSIPVSFWLSTICLVAISIGLQKASWAVAAEDQDRMHLWIDRSGLCAIVFVILQGWGLYSLLDLHMGRAEDGFYRLAGICAALSFVHALHIVGGIVFIVWIKVQGLRRCYDHERHWAVDNCAGYWHFLLIIWFAMLAAFYFC